MDSSSVSAASRAETSVSPVPKGKAATFLGWRWPHRPPAQYAPPIIATATTNNRTAFDNFLALIFTILPRPRLAQRYHAKFQPGLCRGGRLLCPFFSLLFSYPVTPA